MFGTSPQNAPPPARNSPAAQPANDAPRFPPPMLMRHVVVSVLHAREPSALMPTTAWFGSGQVLVPGALQRLEHGELEEPANNLARGWYQLYGRRLFTSSTLNQAGFGGTDGGVVENIRAAAGAVEVKAAARMSSPEPVQSARTVRSPIIVPVELTIVFPALSLSATKLQAVHGGVAPAAKVCSQLTSSIRRALTAVISKDVLSFRTDLVI